MMLSTTTVLPSFYYGGLASAVLLLLSSIVDHRRTGVVVFVQAQLRDDIDFSWNPVKLPFELSDMTATYIEGEDGDEDGAVILVGGCDSLNGNERISVDGEDLFACLSTSNVTLRFDPFADTFTEMAPTPHARQRHAAVVVDGEIYVFGGRDSDDNLVPEIDSFNPATNTWTPRGRLPDDVVTSDLTAWTWKQGENHYVYLTGGFQFNYTAVGDTYRLNMALSGTNGPVTFEEMQYEPMTASPHPRGDFHAVALYGYAYLAGGITHTSLWCEGLKTTERYHMATNTWERLGDLNTGRADMAVALLNGKIVAVGGETKPDDCIDQSDPAYGSFPADTVDVLLDPVSMGSNAKWTRFEDFNDERFRFSAAVVPALNKMYTFGGQRPYDFTCDCFPTSLDVGVGQEVYQAETPINNAAIIASTVLGGIIALLLIFVIGRHCFIRQRKNAMEKETAEQPDAEFDSKDGATA